MRTARAIFARLAIKRKLIALMMLASSAALLLAGVTLSWYEWTSSRTDTLSNLQALAAVIGGNSTAAIAFDDGEAGQSILSALEAVNEINRAVLYGPSGTVLASYTRGNGQSESRPAFGEISLRRSIVLDGKVIGALSITASEWPMVNRICHYLAILLPVMLLSSVVTVGLASRLQRLISDPILDLAEKAALVGSLHDYSIRAEKQSGDELGILVDQFNSMLAQIEETNAQLRNARDSLEERVVERTAELGMEIEEHKETAEALLIAKEAAEEASRTKSTFLATMSHELRTPLNAVIGYSQLLQEQMGKLRPEQTESDLRKIESAGKHLLALINDVLDLSKIEAGKTEVYREVFSVPALVEDVINTVRPQARQRGNLITVHLSPEVSQMYSDMTKVRQTLLNLLSNASKFTENGAIDLAVRLAAGAHGAYVEFGVTDTGIGISNAQMQRLFSPFSQADASTTRKYGGTGLGLVISQRFCQLLGGGISVSSEPGIGSIFTMRLPRGRADTVSEDAMALENSEVGHA